jgi:L-lactate dehydrogenase (cytochrome)
LRDYWQGKLVLKGVMHPEDARLAKSLGVDAVIVSNHGGRQLDSAIAPLQALPEIVRAVGKQFPVCMDGGIRRGTDVLKAVALGASLVFMGRPQLYGAAVAQQQGVEHIIEIMRSEIDRNMALLGCATLADVSTDLLALSGGFGHSGWFSEPE